MRAWAACLLVALAALTGADARGIMGIDFGHEFMKVSLVKPGMPFQVVANFQSKRKTPSMLAFYSGERVFGSDAEGLMGRKPQLVFSSPQRVLGRNLTHPTVIDYANASFLATSVVENVRGGIDFVVPGGGGIAPATPVAEGEPIPDATYSAEELSAMLLAHAKEFASATAGLPLTDCVITVPSYFTQFERQAILDAAKLAGLSVLALVDDNTAAGVQYGIDRVFDNATHHMLLFNMGSEATQATLFAYDSYPWIDRAAVGAARNKTVGQGRVLSKAWDTGLGGRHLDNALINYVSEKFNAEKGKNIPASAKGDIRNVPAAMAKLRKNIVKTKEILSANEEYTMHVESLLPSVDLFRVTLNRKTLDTIAEEAGLGAERITRLLDDVCAQAGVAMSTVDVVEIVGGGVRVPRVQAVIRDHLAKAAAAAALEGRKGPTLGQHLNGDDAMALGAAFHAANRSAAFKVRKVGMIDGLPWGVGVRIAHLNPTTEPSPASSTDAPAATKAWSKRSSPFRAYERTDGTKRITFSTDKDLKAVLFYEQPASASADASASPASAPIPAGTPRNIAAYNITGIADLASQPEYLALNQTPKIHLSIEIDAFGLARIVKAEATLEKTEQVPVATPTPSPSASPAAGNETESTGAEGEASASATPSPAPTEEGSDAAASASASANETVQYKTVKRTLRFPLAITPAPTGISPVLPLSPADEAASLATLTRLNKLDEERRAREGAKNALEAYIYASREKRDGAGDDELASVSTDDQRDALSSALMDAEDWLYGDGAAATIEEYKARLKEVKAAVEPVFTRLEEARARPKLIADVREYVAKAREVIAGWNKSMPQITANEMSDATASLEALSSWFEGLVADQEGREGHLAPVLTKAAVHARLKVVGDLLTRLSKKPKPATPKPTVKPATGKGTGKKGDSKGKGGKAGSAGGAAGAEGEDAEGAGADSGAEYAEGGDYQQQPEGASDFAEGEAGNAGAEGSGTGSQQGQPEGEGEDSGSYSYTGSGEAEPEAGHEGEAREEL